MPRKLSTPAMCSCYKSPQLRMHAETSPKEMWDEREKTLDAQGLGQPKKGTQWSQSVHHHGRLKLVWFLLRHCLKAGVASEGRHALEGMPRGRKALRAEQRPEKIREPKKIAINNRFVEALRPLGACDTACGWRQVLNGCGRDGASKAILRLARHC